MGLALDFPFDQELYDELHQLARRQMRRSGDQFTLQPTALVHEAFLRLSKQRDTMSQRTKVAALGALMIRRILVDHARRRLSDRRGEGRRPVTLTIDPEEPGDAPIEILALHEAMAQLAKEAPRKARVVELRYFGGLTLDEVAEELGVSGRTAANDWSFAKAWLFRELSGHSPRDSSSTPKEE